MISFRQQKRREPLQRPTPTRTLTTQRRLHHEDPTMHQIVYHTLTFPATREIPLVPACIPRFSNPNGAFCCCVITLSEVNNEGADAVFTARPLLFRS